MRLASGRLRIGRYHGPRGLAEQPDLPTEERLAASPPVEYFRRRRGKDGPSRVGVPAGRWIRPSREAKAYATGETNSMALQPGTPAPDFALTLKPGEAPLRLGDYRGEKPVVLLFFPLAFSAVCTTELDEVCSDYDRWSKLDAVVIGVSIDSAFVNQRFAEELGARFPIVSDFNKEAATSYGVLNNDYYGMRGVANRSAFVIDRRGVIAYSWMSEDPSILPPFNDIEAAVIGAL